MKFEVQNGDLLAGLKRVTSAVERRSTIPILSNVLLTADKKAGALRIKATDLDVTLETSIPAEVESAGAITVPGTLFQNIADKLASKQKKADAKPVKIELGDKDALKISSGRSRFTLQTLPASDFPAPETPASNHQFDLSADQVRALFKRPAFAISTEETRYYLSGIYLHTVNGSLRAVATDGHRLARVDCEKPEGADGIVGNDGKAGIIVPAKSVAAITKIAEGAEKVHFEISPTRIVASNTLTTLTSKLIESSPRCLLPLRASGSPHDENLSERPPLSAGGMQGRWLFPRAIRKKWVQDS
jgi:DNA polymerase-3 subunit beta